MQTGMTCNLRRCFNVPTKPITLCSMLIFIQPSSNSRAYTIKHGSMSLTFFLMAVVHSKTMIIILHHLWNTRNDVGFQKNTRHSNTLFGPQPLMKVLSRETSPWSTMYTSISWRWLMISYLSLLFQVLMTNLQMLISEKQKSFKLQTSIHSPGSSSFNLDLVYFTFVWTWSGPFSTFIVAPLANLEACYTFLLCLIALASDVNTPTITLCLGPSCRSFKVLFWMPGKLNVAICPLLYSPHPTQLLRYCVILPTRFSSIMQHHNMIHQHLSLICSNIQMIFPVEIFEF